MTVKELLILLCLLFFALISRLWRLAEPAVMYFDEPYHLSAAKLLSTGDWRTPFQVPLHSSSEATLAIYDWLHPPLAKYLQAISIHYLGLNAWAWRLPSVILAILTLIVFYFLVRFLANHFFLKAQKKTQPVKQASTLALIATFFLSLNGLFLVQSRIAMNDVFVLFFVLLAILFYLNYLLRYSLVSLFAVGLSFGLALASKWSAFWLLLFLLSQELWSLKKLRQLPFVIFALVLTPAMIYLLLYLPMFIQGQNLADFYFLQKNMLASQLSNPATHLYSSGPLSWALNLRPVWYFVEAKLPEQTWVANIYALDNPLLTIYFFFGLLYLFYRGKRQQLSAKSKQTVAFLLALYGVSFLPWLFFSRIMFIYHYLLALPFITILLAYACLDFCQQIKDRARRRALLFNLLFWPLFSFILFYPHWTAWPVPATWAQHVYFYLAFWR